MIRKTLVSVIIFLLLAACNSKTYNKEKAIEFNDKAVTFMMDFQNDSAIVYFEHAIKLDPNIKYAHYNLRILYAKEGLIEKAIEVSEKYLKVAPDFAEIWIGTGMFYEKTNDSLKARKYYNKGIELLTKRLDNNEDDILQSNRLNRAVAYILIGNEELGQKEIKEVLDENPDNETAKMFEDLGREEILNQ
jgi:tetratricopeptide (TPR) repeat protein